MGAVWKGATMSKVQHVELVEHDEFDEQSLTADTDSCGKEVGYSSGSDDDEEGAGVHEEGPKNQMFVVLLCLFASLGGIMFGYDTGINGGVQVSDSFINDLCVGNYDQGNHTNSKGLLLSCHAEKAEDQPHDWIFAKEAFVSLLSVGAMIGAIMGGPISEEFGRRVTIAIGAGVFSAATFYTILCQSVGSILVGRFLLGLPVGMLSYVTPVYAAEVAPKELRGVLGSLMQFSIVSGILIATVIAVPIEHVAGGWRIALGLCAVPSLILVAFIFCFPESPRWLCKYVDLEAAKAALIRLRKTEEIHAEAGEIAVALEAESGASRSYADLWEPSIRSRLGVAMGLQVLQQATGVNSIFYYAPTIFADVGISDPLVGGLICGVANLLGTCFGLKYVDSFGRRTLLLVGGVGMTIGMLGSAMLLFVVDVKASPAAGDIVILLICVFVLNFACSWGPICWLYPAEIFPMRVRAKAVSLSTLANWVMNVAVAAVVPDLLRVLSAAGLFMLFGVCGVGCTAFVIFFVPETKGKSLEDINKIWAREADLISPRSTRSRGGS